MLPTILLLVITLVAFATVRRGLAAPPAYSRLATVSINCRPTRKPFN